MLKTCIKLMAALLAPAAAQPSSPLESVWIRSQAPGAAAPEVHAVRAAETEVVVESAGLSLQSFGPLQTGGPAPAAGGPRRFAFAIPRAPRPAGRLRPSVAGSIVGAFVNGTPLYTVLSPVSYQDRNLWHRDLVRASNAAPTPLLTALFERRQRHSPIIGFALDGYPVYGPYGWDGNKQAKPMRSSYRLAGKRTDGPPENLFPLGTFTEDYLYERGAGDLDESNGRFAITPEYPQGTYAYFLSTHEDGALAYPYLIGPALHGQIDAGLGKLRKLGVSEDWTAYVSGNELTLVTPLDTLQRVHERILHLFLVSDGLDEFAHIHPEPVAPGVFRIEHSFTRGGTYRVFADYTPGGGSQKFARFTWRVPDPAVAAAAPSASSLRVTFQSAAPLAAGADIPLRFSLRDAASNFVVADLEPFLGAWAHIVIISADGGEIIHVHPDEAAAEAPAPDGDPWRHSHGGPIVAPPTELSARAGFRKPGRYKMWLQTQRAGAVINTEFWLEVAAGAGGAPAGPAGSIPTGAIRVLVSERGFEPARIEARRGSAVRLAFLRLDAQNCGREVVAPALKIRRELPVGQVTVIEIPAGALGEAIEFTCGMGMYRGALVAR